MSMSYQQNLNLLKMAIKTFVKKGRVLICVVSRKNFKFSDKNKKGKDKCINYEKFGYCQFNCSKKKMITNPIIKVPNI